MTTLVDTNVLISLLNEAEAHHAWCVERLRECKLNGPALINDIVYCEFTVPMQTQEAADAAVTQFAIERVANSDAALFRAGKAFREYKDKNKGPKLGVLPDFLIGANAEVLGVPLLTANPGDFSGYFPNLQLIAP